MSDDVIVVHYDIILVPSSSGAGLDKSGRGKGRKKEDSGKGFPTLGLGTY